MMTANMLPLALDPWIPHAVAAQYRRDIAKRIPRALMLTLVTLHHTAQPDPLVIAEMKSPRLQIPEEDLIKQATARVIHGLAGVWEVPLEIHIGQRPYYNDPGATILLIIKTVPDPATLGPTRRGPGRYFHGIIFRMSASNLTPFYP